MFSALDRMKSKGSKKYKGLIWDWNGTLLNDLSASIDAMNEMLRKRNLKEIDLEYYRKIFTFPVQNYYITLGFDFTKEDWHTTAMEFIELYRRNVLKCHLQPDAITVLQYFRNSGIRQFILSAMERDFLLETLSCRLDVGLFEIITGLDNHYATTKEQVAQSLLQSIALPSDQVIVIGDTIHDFEVASTVGIECILVANGHQSRERLLTTGCTVLDSLHELIPMIW